MLRSKEELLSKFREIAGDDVSDSIIEFVEDLSDSLTNDVTDLESKIASLEQEKADIEASWRKKYRDRFFEPENPIQDGEQIAVINDGDNADESGEEEPEIPTVEEIVDKF